MKTLRLVLLGSLVSSLALAQTVEVRTGGKKVKVGAGGVDVQTGGAAVKVKAGGTTVQVEGDDDDAPPSGGAVTATPAREEEEAEEAWALDGQGETHTHECGPGQAVRISGQNHTVTLLGPCGAIDVNGQGHQVTTQLADAITISGQGNRVQWRAARAGKKPKLSLSGQNNSAPQLKGR